MDILHYSWNSRPTYRHQQNRIFIFSCFSLDFGIFRFISILMSVLVSVFKYIAISVSVSVTDSALLHNQLTTRYRSLKFQLVAILVPKLIAIATSLSTAGPPIYNTWFLRPIPANNPSGVSIGSAVFAICTDYRKVSLYFTMGRPFPPPSKLPHGGSGPSSNTWFFAPTWVLNPNGISIGAAFARLTSVTDRPTDRQTNRPPSPRYSVSNNRHRLHLRT